MPDTKDEDTTAEFRLVDMDYNTEGVDKIIAIKKKDLLNGEDDPEESCPVPEGVHDSLATMTEEMQQQVVSLRRLMYLMSALGLVIFLTALSSLVVAVATTTGKTPSSNQANSSQGTVVSVTWKCSQ